MAPSTRPLTTAVKNYPVDRGAHLVADAQFDRHFIERALIAAPAAG